MTISPNTDISSDKADDPAATFGGTAAEAEMKKPSERIRMGSDRPAYTRRSMPVMTWLRNAEIVDDEHPLGNVENMSTEDLEQDVFLCGVPLLELVYLAAASYQLTSSWAGLGNLICTSTCDAPHASVETGIDANAMPLNFLIALMGVSGRGKGSALRLPLKMCYDQAFQPQKTAASGEALIRMFFEQIDVADGGKAKRVWARREGAGVWVNWDEIDQFVAKSGITGQKGNTKAASTTLGSTLRSLYVGGQVGDEALNRDNDHAYLDAGSYRFVCTIQGQPDRMGALVNDDTGGTLQRLLIFPTQREDDKPTPAEWMKRKELLCQKLGVPVMKTCPSILAWGPHRRIELTEEVEHLLVAGRLDNAYDDRDPVDGHIDSIRIRLAALFAGWVAGFEQDAVVDMTAWWWASCVLERARRARNEAKKAADQSVTEGSKLQGIQDAYRRTAAEEATEVIEMDLIYPKVKKRIRHLMKMIPSRAGRATGIQGLASISELNRGLSSPKTRAFLTAALGEGLNDGWVEEHKAPDGTPRYRLVEENVVE